MDNYKCIEEFIFNTRVFLKINNCENSSFILNKSIEIMKDFESTLSLYNKNSEISKINKNANKDFVNVSKDTFNIISQAKHYSTMTDGLFDITVAPLVKAWNINTSNPQVLTHDQLENLLPLVNYKDIILDSNNCRVMLSQKNQSIDLGGIAKGYIADYIIEFLKSNNVTNAIVNIGGNVVTLNNKIDNTPWSIGVFEPVKHSNKIICSLEVNNMSVVTSGIYERAFICNNKLYHHILNPKTGTPANTDLQSITIINENSLLCDSLATPLLIMGAVKASQFMKRYNISGIMITTDNKIIISKDLIDTFTLHEDYKLLSF